VLAEWRTSPATGKLRAALGFLEKLTLTPQEIGPADVVSLRQTGLDERAILDALYVCIGFNVIVRIADALEFVVPPSPVFDRAAKYLLLFGYRLLSGKFFGGASFAAAGHDPYERGIQLIKQAALSDYGHLSLELRRAALSANDSGNEINGLLGEYVSLVKRRAWDITDADIEALRQAGLAEDQIFEATVCAALGAGLLRLERGLAALRQSTQT
jgi:alkylhydroperoxidase family enzyme